jgi:hypothetical protein
MRAMKGTQLAWWGLFAASFGYVEAAVVDHIRSLMDMPEGMDYPAIWRMSGYDFHSGTIGERIGGTIPLPAELWREVATLLLLLGTAMAAGRTPRERLGLFAFNFAVWDLTYYLWLRLLTGFPRSLADTDIYFLLPWPLYGPVWLPVAGMSAVLLLALRLLRPSRSVTGRVDMVPRPTSELECEGQ